MSWNAATGSTASGGALKCSGWRAGWTSRGSDQSREESGSGSRANRVPEFRNRFSTASSAQA